MDGEKAIGKSYDGPSGVGRDSQWLTWEDLPEGKALTATIEDVQLFQDIKFQGGRTKDRMLGLKFVRGTRILGLNATNRKILVKMFGNSTGGWKQQQVELYVAQTQMAGETVNCVRIRDRGSRAVAAGKAALAAAPKPGNGAAGELPLTGVAPTWPVLMAQQSVRLGLTDEETNAIVDNHQGDFEAAYKELVERQA